MRFDRIPFTCSCEGEGGGGGGGLTNFKFGNFSGRYPSDGAVSMAAKGLSPFLIGRMFLREASWKYSAKLVGS